METRDAPPDSIALAERASTWLSAYVHVPFCHRVCPYCDFAVVAGRSDLADRYVEALIREISLDQPLGPLDAVFVGGGTPSRLSPPQLGRVLAALSNRHGIAPGAELSIEANPEDWTPDYSARLRDLGFTRVSLGVQSFDPDVLAYLGREHGPEQAAQAIATAGESEWPSVSIDLIYGSPVESMPSWDKTVRLALAADIHHLSTYALTVERGTELSRQVAAGAPAPDDDDQADKWELVDRLASGAGLVRYEVSNAALAGHPCRYNLATWGQGEYAGYGLGAHGHRDGVRTRNVRRLDRYLERVELTGSARTGADRGDRVDREIERLMLGLRRRAGVEAGWGGERLIASSQGRSLVEAGVLTVSGDRLLVDKPLLTDAVIRAAMEACRS